MGRGRRGHPCKGSSHKASVTLCFPPAACVVIDQHMGQKFTTPPRKEQENDILTPEAPSIAFPLANPPVAPKPEVRRKIYIKRHSQAFFHMRSFFTS